MGEKTKGTEFEKMLEAYQKNGQIPADVDIGGMLSQIKKQEAERTSAVLKTVELNTRDYVNFVERIVYDAQSKNIGDGFWEGAVKQFGKRGNFSSQLECTKFELRRLQNLLRKIDSIVEFSEP